MPRGDQLARQWRLLHLLDRPVGVSVAAAARDLGCTVRTIWRDLKVLEAAGLPIHDERSTDTRRSLWKIQEEFRLGLPVEFRWGGVAALSDYGVGGSGWESGMERMKPSRKVA